MSFKCWKHPMQGKQLFASHSSDLIIRFLLYAVLLLLLASTTTKAEILPVKSYNTENGLVHDRIRKIVKDSRGFLWICTAEGVSRFDGYDFVNYNRRLGLPANGVNDLLETRDGSYWIATEAGICKLNSSVYQKANNATEPPTPAPLFTVYNL